MPSNLSPWGTRVLSSPNNEWFDIWLKNFCVHLQTTVFVEEDSTSEGIYTEET